MSPEEQTAFDALVDVLAFYQARVVNPPVTDCKARATNPPVSNCKARV